MNGYLLYETDEWHSMHSRVLMGVFTSYAKLMEGIDEYVRQNLSIFKQCDEEEEEHEEETKGEVAERVTNEFCKFGLQTQGYDKNLFAYGIDFDVLKEL